ncbi:Solute carrier family 2, facilitated glucose transporter member 3 [Aphelenchoides bicaudatus]|nr:Solute carrier family 2, facilitated glucose transporter member 3 [Aphelenchoides bicaudatus]
MVLSVKGYTISYPNTSNNNFQFFVNKSYIERGDEPLTDWQFTWFWTWFLNVWSFGYLIGNLITAPLCDSFGRKNTLVAGNSLNLVSAIIFTCAVYFNIPELLFVGRLICSVASSVLFSTSIIFLQEIAPTNLRGVASATAEISMLVTSLIGIFAGMDLILGRHLVVLLGFAIIPSAFSIIFLLPMPDTPKYLLMNADDRVAAEHALQYYQGNRLNTDMVLNEMSKEAMDARMDMKLWEALCSVFKNVASRRAVCVGILAIQLSTPIWPLTFLTTELLESRFSSDMAQASTFIFVMIMVVASLIGTLFIERIDRRPLFIRLGIANTLSLAAYVIFDRLAEHLDSTFRYGCVLSLIGYGLSYGFGLGPIAFFLTGELVPQRERALVQSIVFGTNTIINFIVSFSLLPLYKLIDIYAFIPLFLIPATCALIYLHFNMPETRNKEIHEIVQAFTSKSNHAQSKKPLKKKSAVPSESGMVEIDLNDYERKVSGKMDRN